MLLLILCYFGISEKNITSNLQTKNIPDPDLLIRTGNTKRLSNFLLWQLSYSEIFFSKKFKSGSAALKSSLIKPFTLKNFLK